MREKRFSPLALILTAVVTLCLTLGAVALTAWLRLGPGGLAVLQGMEVIQSRFVGGHDAGETADAALYALVDSLGDRWSAYLSQEEYRAMAQRRENRYVGVGLTYRMGEDGTYFEIVGLTPGGPAETAGLAVGDRVSAINGESLTGENYSRVIATIADETGRDVVFTVLGADGGVREVTVRTAKLDDPPVETILLDSGVGYVRLDNFYTNSAGSARQAVGELVDQGAKALLFDVRYNPGGYVTELTALLDYLLPEGPVFRAQDKGKAPKVTYSDGSCVDLPMAVLVNADTYSAAELFAAQLRESVDAPIIGVQTSGKGYYQQAFRLINGGAMNISTGVYTTGGGVSLAGVGLTPDVVEEDLEAQTGRAVQLLEERLG